MIHIQSLGRFTVNHGRCWCLIAIAACCSGLGCGNSTSPGESVHTITFPTASTQQWVKQVSVGSQAQLGSAPNDFTTTITRSQDDNVTAIGRITRSSEITSPVQGQEFLASYDSSGNIVSSVSLNQDMFADVSTIATSTPDGNYVAASVPATVLSMPSLLPLNVAKFTPDGSIIWHATLPTTGQISEFQPRTITVDTSGNVFVAGQVTGQGGGGVFLAKFAASSGDVVWQNDYLYIPDRGMVQNIAVGPGGDLYVAVAGLTGFDQPETSESSQKYFLAKGEEYFLAKLDGSTGQIIWSSPSSVGEAYTGVAVNSIGTGYIIGTLARGSNSYTGYLAGFSSQSGALTWQGQFGKGTLLPTNITVDGPGNAVFAGYVEGANLSGPTIKQQDLFVATIDPNGHPIWIQTFGTGHEEQAQDGEVPLPPYLVTDSQGNIYLAGITLGAFPGFQNPGGQTQTFIAKFSPQ